jgi:hypothetical protein
MLVRCGENAPPDFTYNFSGFTQLTKLLIKDCTDILGQVKFSYQDVFILCIQNIYKYIEFATMFLINYWPCHDKNNFRQIKLDILYNK